MKNNRNSMTWYCDEQKADFSYGVSLRKTGVVLKKAQKAHANNRTGNFKGSTGLPSL